MLAAGEGRCVYKDTADSEGYNIFDIAQAVEAAGLGSSVDWRHEEEHVELIAQWSPQATSLEGYLFPDTYYWRTSRRRVVILSTR